jgi:hypothetical protein
MVVEAVIARASVGVCERQRRAHNLMEKIMSAPSQIDVLGAPIWRLPSFSLGISPAHSYTSTCKRSGLFPLR